MSKTFQLFATLCLISTAAGCDTELDPECTDGTCTGIMTGTGGSLDSETETETDALETGASQTGADESETDSDMCMSNADCGESEICQDGACQLTCGTQTFQVSGDPPNIMLVLDKSGSMVQDQNRWDHDGDPTTDEVTRWYSLHGVVTNLVEDFDADIHLGATLFPSVDAQTVAGPPACVMSQGPEVTVAPHHGQTILDTIPAADDLTLAGGTPAERGLAMSYDHLNTLDDPGDRIAILVTDGAANCSTSQDNNHLHLYDENLEPTVSTAWEVDGIPTYVVGIDISTEPDVWGTVVYDRLNEVADAGGVAREGDEKFYNATNHQQLQTALQSILEASIPCTLPMPELGKNDYLEQVMIDGVNYPKLHAGADCASETGWMLSTDETQLILCGDLCSDYRQAKSVDTVLGCSVG